MKYKMLAFDIDGTLVNSDKKITEATKTAILKAAQQGSIIVIASGRPIQGLWKYARELELEKYKGYLLAFNGGRVVSVADQRVVSEELVPARFYKKIYDLAKENNVNILTFDGDTVISENIENEYLNIEVKLNGLKKRQVANLYEELDFEVNKFLMMDDGDYLGEVEKKVYNALHNELDVYRSEPFFLEVLPKGINKGKALEKLIGELGIKREELMTFGDGYNDVTMIEYAGMGVAMGNARDVVKEKADYIAKSNDEDGIVEVIEKFVLD